MSEKTFFFVKREIPLSFFVNCERADLFFVKRDLYPPPPLYHPQLRTRFKLMAARENPGTVDHEKQQFQCI